MRYTLPGTTIEITPSSGKERDVAKRIFDNVFCTGGLVMNQVVTITGLESYIIQNWIKRGFLSSPVKKQYSKRQLARIIIVNMLKDSMQIDRIIKLLSYINGVLSDESDDLVDDYALYNYYVNLVFEMHDGKSLVSASDLVLVDYLEPVPGAKKRLARVLEIMYYAGLAAEYSKKSDMLLCELD